jgi:3-oxoacyl-[acyl-carrier protein] reductase
MRSLTGQVALITGAGSPTGIGFACARALGADGAKVVLVSTTDRIHERVKDLDGEGIKANGIVADLTREEAVLRLAELIEDRHGRLDICVNNAGMIVVGEEAFIGSMDQTSVAEWQKTLDRNLNTCFLVTRAVLPLMRREKYGRIVNIASTSGPVSAFIGDVAYHAAKAAMVGLTRAVALEEAAHGIMVNAIAPGWIATGSQLEEEAVAGRLTPLKRSGTPEEVAHAVRFLADPDASYITGQLLVVDGGNGLPEDRAWKPDPT